jgi:hypothetical protein
MPLSWLFAQLTACYVNAMNVTPSPFTLGFVPSPDLLCFFPPLLLCR